MRKISFHNSDSKANKFITIDWFRIMKFKQGIKLFHQGTVASLYIVAIKIMLRFSIQHWLVSQITTNPSSHHRCWTLYYTLLLQNLMYKMNKRKYLFTNIYYNCNQYSEIWIYYLSIAWFLAIFVKSSVSYMVLAKVL